MTLKGIKTVILEDINGIKSFLTFSSTTDAFAALKKLSKGSGTFFCESEDQFNKIKERETFYETTPIAYKTFVGIGFYDYEGNHYSKITQEDGTCSIEGHTEQTHYTITHPIKINEPNLN